MSVGEKIVDALSLPLKIAGILIVLYSAIKLFDKDVRDEIERLWDKTMVSVNGIKH